MSVVAVAMGKVDHFDEPLRLVNLAEELANSAAKPETRVSGLTSVAKALAKLGDAERATQLLDQVEALSDLIIDSRTKAETLVSLAATAAALGEFDRAEMLVRSIAEPGAVSWGLNRITTIIAESGDYDRAANIAQTIVDNEEYCGGLIALAQDPDPQRARFSMACVFMLSRDWPAVLHSLGRFHPEASMAIIDELAFAAARGR
jgi:hypothetical protein